MKKKQQIVERPSRITDSLSLEMELNNFIDKAIKEGYSLGQATKYVTQFVSNNWHNYLEIPEENADETAFRAKVQAFFDTNYEKFADYCKLHVNDWYWAKVGDNARIREELKKRFIYEVAGSMYKGFEMDTLDEKELKEYVIKRVKKLIPEIKKGHVMLFNVTVYGLLRYAELYGCPEERENEFKAFLSQFELQSSYDRKLCKFIWMIENL